MDCTIIRAKCIKKHRLDKGDGELIRCEKYSSGQVAS